MFRSFEKQSEEPILIDWTKVYEENKGTFWGEQPRDRAEDRELLRYSCCFWQQGQALHKHIKYFIKGITDKVLPWRSQIWFEIT